MIVAGINSGLDGALAPVRGGSAALIADGEILGAVAEERISREKWAGGFSAALPALLDDHGLSLTDVDAFYLSFYGNPPSPRDELIRLHLDELGLGRTPEKLVTLTSHHRSHAALAFFLSPFDEAAILTADNEGTLLSTGGDLHPPAALHCERNGYYWARGNQITLLSRDFSDPWHPGFGKMYNKFTEYVGFGDYHNAGKTMGLSGYAEVPDAFAGLELWEELPSGALASRVDDTNDCESDLREFFGRHGIDIPPPGRGDDYMDPRYCQMTAFVQDQLCRWAARRCGRLLDQCGARALCVSGGVGLNSVMNSHLERTLGVPVFVPPFPSDQGQALGNAIHGFVRESGWDRNPTLSPRRFGDYFYLGPSHDAESIAAAAEDARGAATRPDTDRLLEIVADLLDGGAVVGWFQGRSEYGARALGNRSVLADPRPAGMRDRVNDLKGRERFRPLAPSVLDHATAEWFEGTDSLLLPGMLGVVRVRPFARERVAAITHVDGTARVQTVSRRTNPRYFDLISAFHRRTGVPLVLNTSFNAAGDPIVETPSQAVAAYEKMHLDALVLDDWLIVRAT